MGPAFGADASAETAEGCPDAKRLPPHGDATMPRSAGGLAIGSLLARSLVALHRGHVRAFDVDGGVVLRADLPLVASD